MITAFRIIVCCRNTVRGRHELFSVRHCLLGHAADRFTGIMVVLEMEAGGPHRPLPRSPQLDAALSFSPSVGGHGSRGPRLRGSTVVTANEDTLLPKLFFGETPAMLTSQAPRERRVAVS